MPKESHAEAVERRAARYTLLRVTDWGVIFENCCLQVNAVWLCARSLVHQSSLRHFCVTEARRWAPYEDGSGSMCPRTDELRERKFTVGLPELVLSSTLPCLNYHFPLNFHLQFHCVLSLANITLLPQFGSSMIPGLALHLLVSCDRFLFWLLIGWPPTRCILRHWNGPDGYDVSRSDTTATHANTSVLCIGKPK